MYPLMKRKKLIGKHCSNKFERFVYKLRKVEAACKHRPFPFDSGTKIPNMIVAKQLIMKLGIVHLNFEARTAEELRHFFVVFKAKLHCIRHVLKNTISAEAKMCMYQRLSVSFH